MPSSRWTGSPAVSTTSTSTTQSRSKRPSEAVDDWVEECNSKAAATLFPSANSWYMGANIPGKPRVFMPYIGGFANYGNICAEVAAAGYKGFEIAGENGA